MRKLLLTILLFLIPTVAFGWGAVLVGSGSPSEDSFPAGWGRKCALVVQASKVPSDQTNFPVLLTLATLPSEMFDADGSYPALSGGGDIRFSSDSAGNTRLACEVVTFTIDNNPANGVAEIHIKVPSVSGTVNTTFYVWYDKDAQSQPAIDSTYGAENVWDSNYKLVQHMNEDPSGSGPQMIDSTSNGNDGTSSGTMISGDLVAAKIGSGLDFDGGDDYIDCQGNASLDLDGDTFTLEAWIEPDIVNAEQGIEGRTKDNESRYSLRLLNNGRIRLSVYTTSWYASPDDGTILSVDTQYYIVGVYDGSNLIRYLNGSSDGTNTSVSGNLGWQSTHADFAIGDTGVGTGLYEFDGVLDELRASNNARSANWVETCFNNQNDPSTFVVEGSPE